KWSKRCILHYKLVNYLKFLAFLFRLGNRNMKRDYWFWALLLCYIKSLISIEASKCQKKTPENRHGVKPLLIIDGEIQPSTNNYLTTIPILSSEWKITLDIKYIGSNPNCCGTSTLFLKDDDQYIRPIINGYAGTHQIHVYHRINGVDSPIVYTVPLNQYVHVQLEQIYVSNGNYSYTVKVDDVIVTSSILSDARQLYNVKVYAGHPHLNGSPAFIKQVKIFNFL
uniref:Uncharacterized protein n=2 Tax=Clytia hemisphaerica TaxID=252671 RepID=A0A7M5UKQ9_9CNID